jgi:hypothetical protein
MSEIIKLLNIPINIPQTLPLWAAILIFFFLMVLISSLHNDKTYDIICKINKIEARIERLKNFSHMDNYSFYYDDNLLSDEFKKENKINDNNNYDYRFKG